MRHLLPLRCDLHAAYGYQTFPPKARGLPKLELVVKDLPDMKDGQAYRQFLESSKDPCSGNLRKLEVATALLLRLTWINDSAPARSVSGAGTRCKARASART